MPNSGSRDIPQKCDIAVIGAGITGIAVAYYLRELGCDDVVVLEKEYIGYGASGKNAGFLLAGLSEPYSRLRIGMGPESAKELMMATMENHDLIAKAIEDNAIKCDYRRSGSCHLAITEVEKREYDDSVELLNKDGFRAESIEYPHGIPKGRLNGFLGGYFNPSDGCLNPFAFVRGLSKDIKVMENFAVTSIGKANGLVRIEGSRGILKAEMAIIAANGYSPLLDKYFERLIFPIRGQMMAATAIENSILGESIYYSNFGYDYFRQDIDNTLLMGGLRNRYLREETGFMDQENPALQDELVEYANRNLGIDNIDIKARWSGLMGGTIDGLPLVGVLPYNGSIICCAGFNGHGFGLATFVARDLARAILYGEKSNILNRFSLRRFL